MMILTKLYGWLAAAAGVLLAIAGAVLYGRSKGKAAAVQANAAATAKVITTATETRHDVDAEVAKLPDAPAQPLATADPHSAAGELRGDWLRD